MQIENAPMEWLSLHRNVGNIWNANSPASYVPGRFSYILSASSEVGAVADLVECRSGNSYTDKLCQQKTLSDNFQRLTHRQMLVIRNIIQHYIIQLHLKVC